MGPCLYCLTTTGEPSIEHVIPAGLGCHADWTLPADAVCKECNNYLGQQIDEPLTQLFEIRLVRGLHQVPDAAGKVVDRVELADGTGDITFDAQGTLHLDRFIKPGQSSSKPDADGVLREAVKTKRRKLGEQRRRAARALLKMGLGIVYRERSADYALLPCFDPARAAILGAEYPGFLLLAPFDEPTAAPDFTVVLVRDLPGVQLAFRFEYGAFGAMVPLSLGPLGEETRAWAKAHGWRAVPISPRNSRRRPSRQLVRLIQNDRVQAAPWVERTPQR